MRCIFSLIVLLMNMHLSIGGRRLIVIRWEGCACTVRYSFEHCESTLPTLYHMLIRFHLHY